MRTVINFPKSGMGIEDGTLIQWTKGIGDLVRKGEIVAEMENAKAVQEIEAPCDGVLKEILVAAGEIVPVNTSLGSIESD
jgi:pyruvate dehydrogenase E2 component (dihydrolipoamide acetyltransferase)